MKRRNFYLIDKDNPSDKRQVRWAEMLSYMNGTSISKWYKANFDFVRYSDEMDQIDFKFVIENAHGDEFYPYAVGDDGSINYNIKGE